MIISDLVQQQPAFPSIPSPTKTTAPSVRGGHLERLPLAPVSRGLANSAEIWQHHPGDRVETRVEDRLLTRRAFPGSGDAPFHSNSMLDFIEAHGAPGIACVWEPGVSDAVLKARANSVIVYNSIDVPTMRVPQEVSRHSNLVLTQSQTDEVLAAHPQMPAAILPIGRAR